MGDSCGFFRFDEDYIDEYLDASMVDTCWEIAPIMI
jgi:hypothetical protein